MFFLKTDAILSSPDVFSPHNYYYFQNEVQMFLAKTSLHAMRPDPDEAAALTIERPVCHLKG